MSKYRTIGILGGMGPEATAELYKRIIQLYQQEKGAVDDADFPNILINSVPAEDMLNDLANRQPVIVKQLQKAAQILERAGAEFIAIPCNTATLFLEDIRSTVSIPILDITELTAQVIKNADDKVVGLLASTSTIKSKIYEDKLNKVDIDKLKPSVADQQKINQIIMRILAGQKNTSDRQTLANIATNMKQKGADTVILGCTELPLLIRDIPDVKLIDTIDVLAEAVFRKAERTRTITENQNVK